MYTENTMTKIIPKVEYQIWFGSEQDSQEETLNLWFWNKFMKTAVKEWLSFLYYSIHILF